MVDSVRRGLDDFNNWFTANNLKLNIAKTNLLHINGKEELRVPYGDQLLTSTPRARFLGLDVDSSLGWRSHVDGLARQLCAYRYGLRVVSRTVSVDAALDVYHACVNSRLRYGVVFWANSVEAERIFKIQKACLRAIFNLNQRDSCKQYFKQNKLLTLTSIFVLECALFVKNNYEHFFKKYEPKHGCNTRGSASRYLLPPKTHLSKIQNTCIYNCIRIFNHIPDRIKTRPYNQFKKVLKSYLENGVFYTLDEFLQNNL